MAVTLLALWDLFVTFWLDEADSPKPSRKAAYSLCEDWGIKDFLTVNVAHAFHQQHAITALTQPQYILLWGARWNHATQFSDTVPHT